METESSNPSPNPETLFLDLVTSATTEVRESGQIISSPHEAYALLHEKLESYWRDVRHRREPAVLLDRLVELAAQCAAAADDLLIKEVIAENETPEGA